MNVMNASPGQLPVYRSHKLVSALLIKGIDPDTFVIHGQGFSVQVDAAWLAKNPRALNENGYYVSYADGYSSWSPARAFDEGNTPVQHWGIPRSQEPKYFINDKGRLANRSTGKPIPDEEPILVLRAKDTRALEALGAYAMVVGDPTQVDSIRERITAFRAFAESYPERMREPDSRPKPPPVPTV